MKKILILISIIYLTGCATQHVFNMDKANTYLFSHKGRPAHIKEALSVGKLAQGMNEEEVKICWGKPDSIEKISMPNHEVIVWKYFGNQRLGYTTRGKTITKKVMSKGVTFNDGHVTTWKEIDYSS